jgi:ABC-type transport system substrate-binding protein
MTVILVACGGGAVAPTTAAVAETPAPEVSPTKVQAGAFPTQGIVATKMPEAKAPATAAPQSTAAPVELASAKDTLIFVTRKEPTTVGGAHRNCSGNWINTACDDLASDPLTWINNETFEVEPLSPIEGWQQLQPDRWQFKLRDNVVFHNGKPWNAEAAAFWITYAGDEETRGHGFGNDFTFHGAFKGEAVDRLTLDIVCKGACPVLPQTTIYTKFFDVEWFENATTDDLLSQAMGLGPYKIIEWKREFEVVLEAFEDYNPHPTTPDSRAPLIKNIKQLWREESLVRAAMVQTGEADLGLVSLDDRHRVPKFKVSTNNEAVTYLLDTIYHPELRKFEVRLALNLAIDCETMVQVIMDGLFECHGAISQMGTTGITAENSKPYGYDPDRARALLKEANYDPAEEIVITLRPGRMDKDVEWAEGVVNYWREVGINAKLNVVDLAVLRQVGRSQCARGRTRSEIEGAPGATLAEKCRNLGPSPEGGRSTSGVTTTTTSTESLDGARQALLRNWCFTTGRVCEDDLVAKIDIAVNTEAGQLRIQRLTEIHDHIREHAHFVPHAINVVVYAMAADLEWEPYYAPRFRGNTAYFK